MRLLSWNINGIRTLPQYHPWNTLKTSEAILNELNADVICFQEMKTSRSSIEPQAALPPGYASFFSFPANKGGYSGVAVYSRLATALPLKAEEGLSGRLSQQSKRPYTEDEQISPSYPSSSTMVLAADEQDRVPLDLLELDLEGRALVIDYGLFVLINLYCPNETSDARLPYKLNYHFLLQERVRKLVEEEGREVIVTGDMNVCAAPIDHCEGALASTANEFWAHPARAWFKNWLDPEGPMADVIRRCWPDRDGMYTCWNTKISARDSNYGTRIDYFLLTKGLLPWFKHGDILPSLKGSDHCPIFIDLHDEIVTESGETLKLRDVMKMNESREVPHLAAKYWKELSGKQTLLSSFFSQPVVSKTFSPSPPCPSPAAEALPTVITPITSKAQSTSSSGTFVSTQTSSQSRTPPDPSTLKPISVLRRPSLPQAHSDALTSSKSTKRKKGLADSNYSSQISKKRKEKPAKGSQANLSSFVLKSSQASSSSNSTLPPTEVIIIEDEDDEVKSVEVDLPVLTSPASSQPLSQDNQSESWMADAISVPLQRARSESKDVWSQLMAPVEPPMCFVHREPAKMFKVNKPGPNKGKTFFVCARPVGAGYDAGKDRRLREEVDPQFKCNFFKWASDVKKESLRQAKS